MRVCERCNQSFKQLALKAVLVDLGCKVYPLPSECYDGEDHNFIKKEPKNETENP